jgi:Zn-dependent protease with chaperone function
MTRGMGAALAAGAWLFLGAAAVAGAQEDEPGRGEKVDGYAEFRSGNCIVTDAQKVCPGPGMKFKGEGEARDMASVPLGYELKAKGKRLADGTLLAQELEAKPNGNGLWEGDIRSATDQAEEQARKYGRFIEGGEGGKQRSVGRLYEDGPYVERVRHIVDTLLPPYLHPEDVRIYVIENKEWNAFAMGNYSIYVFTGLLNDMDDDEVAIVLGHELVHATHEHTRKEFKRAMWVQLAAAGIIGATSTIDDDKKRIFAQLVTGLAATAYSSGYSRSMEDQADRVGLRYAYEAGYDVTKGPRLWNRFAKKYGEGSKLTNFFFADHSQSAARATKLEKEIAFNYPDGPKAGGPVRMARRPAPPSASAPAAASTRPAPQPAPGMTQALAPSRPSAAAAPSTSADIKRGMTVDEVRKALGDPQAEVVFGEKTRWTYPDLVIVFERGRVADVKF